jgi:hypothetical protein
MVPPSVPGALTVELLKDGTGFVGAQSCGQGRKGLDDAGGLVRAEIAQRGGQGSIGWDQRGPHHVLWMLSTDLHQGAAAVARVGKSLDGPLFPHPRDGLGHVALRHADAGGDLADGAPRMGEDVGDHAIGT